MNATLLVLLLTAVLATAQRDSYPALPPDTNLPTPRNHAYKPFCRALLKDPKPLTSDCHQSTVTKRCRDGSYRLFGQMRQDYYIYTRHFRGLNRRGVYIDVATNEPISISNTYFMDACLGWSGLCVEAHPGLIPKIHLQRSCAVLPTCVGDVDGAVVDFVLDEGLSGVKQTNKNRARWRGKRGVRSIKRVCTTLSREFEKWDVKLVDYLSLDVEGHELHVLKGIDWDKVKINVMTVEVTKDSLAPLETYLRSVGYVRHWPDIPGAETTGLLSEDAVFLHKDVVWGQPQ